MAAMIQGFMLGTIFGMFLELACIALTMEKKGLNNMKQVNVTEITVQDCIDMFEKKNMYTVIDGGKIVGFVSTTELKGEK
jgi:hypothetical protein